MKNLYRVAITETVVHTYDIVADNRDEAERLAINALVEGGEPDDFVVKERTAEAAFIGLRARDGEV